MTGTWQNNDIRDARARIIPINASLVAPSQAVLSDFYWVTEYLTADAAVVNAKTTASGNGFLISYSNISFSGASVNFITSGVGIGTSAGRTASNSYTLTPTSYVGCGTCGVGTNVTLNYSFSQGVTTVKSAAGVVIGTAPATSGTGISTYQNRQNNILNGADLTALLGNGKTISLGGPGEGYTGSLTLNADGTGLGSATDTSGVKVLTGTWSIKQDQFCRKWTLFDGGNEVCESWKLIGENKVEVLVNGTKIAVNYW